LRGAIAQEFAINTWRINFNGQLRSSTVTSLAVPCAQSATRGC
jgi:hypothetical protein